MYFLFQKFDYLGFFLNINPTARTIFVFNSHFCNLKYRFGLKLYEVLHLSMNKYIHFRLFMLNYTKSIAL